MEMNGVSFRSPTTTEGEHNVCSNFTEFSKKRNFTQVFDRDPFVMECVLLPKKYDKGRSKGKFKKEKKGNNMYKDQYCDETVPNLEYLFEHEIG